MKMLHVRNISFALLTASFVADSSQGRNIGTGSFKAWQKVIKAANITEAMETRLTH